MKTERFDKKLFKQEVLNNLKTQFRVELNNASQQQIYQAVAYALKEWIIEDWMDTQKTYEEKDPKILYYMSMEFLMGRALGNNLINMSMYGEVKEALDELGVDLNAVEDQEPEYSWNLHREYLMRSQINRESHNIHMEIRSCLYTMVIQHRTM